mmetsp:Transcript_5665/g.10625  ORF Transcript_5665/g.10625 Transcript_5665/m.10625 type:complete len:214 (-) Transcript_5665:376-1017(-)
MVMCVRQADLFWCFCISAAQPVLLECLRIPVGFTGGPQDEVHTLTTLNVVRSVPMSAQVEYSLALFVFIRVQKLSMACVRHSTAEGQCRACEVLAKAHVQRHVRVILMHIQANIFTSLVSDNEAVMIIRFSTLFGKECHLQWQQMLLLQRSNCRFQTQLVQHNSVAVHTIRPLQVLSVCTMGILHFFKKLVTERLREQLERIDPWSFSFQMRH